MSVYWVICVSFPTFSLFVSCRISLGTFLFICLDIGPIWIMELNKANERNSATNPTQPPLTNTSSSSQVKARERNHEEVQSPMICNKY